MENHCGINGSKGEGDDAEGGKFSLLPLQKSRQLFRLLITLHIRTLHQTSFKIELQNLLIKLATEGMKGVGGICKNPLSKEGVLMPRGDVQRKPRILKKKSLIMTYHC